MARIGVVRERAQAERRVALTPDAIGGLVRAGHSATVETGAGTGAGFIDQAYADAGAEIGDLDGLAQSELVVSVRGLGTFAESPDPTVVLGPSTATVAMFDPLWLTAEMAKLADTGATVLALELVPRITRAQSMDVLSSTASVAGYEAVVLAATRFGRMFPLMMTAAGTLPAAKVLVLGAGVAGLAAIATARRLGAVVSGYDVRDAAAEQIESLGARAIRLDIGGGPAEGSGGYARSQTDDENRRRRDALAEHVAASDIVITTAAIPGRASPLLITTEMIAAMEAGSVIVDLAAARGGNCEPTVADTQVDSAGVLVLSPTDLASRSPVDASSMFATNVVNLIDHMCDDDANLVIDPGDEITGALIVASGGQVVHGGVIQALDNGATP